MLVKSDRYTCSGSTAIHHRSFSRARAIVDDAVRAAVTDRLRSGNAVEVVDLPHLPGFSEASARLVAHALRVQRVDRDFAAGFLTLDDVWRVQSDPEVVLATRERNRILEDAGLGLLLEAEPSVGFPEADVPTQRLIASALVSVRLFPQPRGGRGVDASSLRIDAAGAGEVFVSSNAHAAPTVRIVSRKDA